MLNDHDYFGKIECVILHFDLDLVKACAEGNDEACTEIESRPSGPTEFVDAMISAVWFDQLCTALNSLITAVSQEEKLERSPTRAARTRRRRS